MHGFETVQQELDAKRRQLEQELQAAQGKVADIRTDLERVHEALAALTGTKKKARSRSRSQKKPASTVQDLQQHIAHVREEHPFADGHELQKTVRSLVRESGCSLAGFETLFAEALVSSPGYSGSHPEAEPAQSHHSHASHHAHASQPEHRPEHGHGSHHERDAHHERGSEERDGDHSPA